MCPAISPTERKPFAGRFHTFSSGSPLKASDISKLHMSSALRYASIIGICSLDFRIAGWSQIDVADRGDDLGVQVARRRAELAPIRIGDEFAPGGVVGGVVVVD